MALEETFHGQPVQAVVQPQPAPISLLVEVATIGARSMVVLRIFSVTGQSIYFLDHESAKVIAENISKAAAQAKLGLTIVGGGLEKP